ncbi:hypothetical protein [Arthrobacter glacialis]|uniref:Uncharacterized protein n=1 Tax=Arthrobacter glacialis TaxID=1664 RepID=A0A2S3ZTK6_ARTGL|nr:hypothetical protein [Arthrobacter glacialis]POH57266.1 hypothetical protein CVS28_16865 [Arthrobacter glacialis]POH72409.1 hypothetical protein CVS27_16125 [Arthrobacter glacialis]
MATYSSTESSSSKHPADWGRAMAVALTRVVAQGRADGHYIEHDNLYGADLHLTIAEAAHGVQITLCWSPDELETTKLAKPPVDDQ